jgi:hypothetical protein
MIVLAILGWLLIVSGAVAGLVAHAADRRLQAYRLPGKPASSYWFVPIRLRRELYRPEAGYLVDRFWNAILAMYGLALLGACLLALSSAPV